METKKKRKHTLWITLLVLIIIGVGVYLIFGRNQKELQVTSRAASQGEVEITVMATGYIQPVEKVDVGTQVSGIVERIYVDFNSVVAKNDLLAELDKQTLREKLAQSRASLESAQADLEYSRSNYNRTEQLYNVKAATQVAFEEAKNSLQRANTSLVNAEANLSQAILNLGYADIKSPIDGVVLGRAVEQGQTVAASFNTPTLFTIAKDLTKMQVEASVDEADIGKVRVGQKVTFSVDAYSSEKFSGTVQQVRIQPVVSSNVVTYTVIIEAPNPDLKLFPGMTANVYIITENQLGVAVSVEAIYFTMTSDIARELNINKRDMDAMDRRKQQIWVKAGDSWELREIKTGIQDGINIIVHEGVNEGEEVILSASLVKQESGGQAVNPLMPQRRR